MPALTTARTRLGLGGFARQPHGSFTGKSQVTTFPVSRFERETWSVDARPAEVWAIAARAREVWDTAVRDAEIWSSGL